MAKSTDGGRTWTRIDGILPPGYATHQNCPSIYRLVDTAGKARIWVWSASLGKRGGPGMPSILSEDDGATWREMPPLGFPCVMTFSSIVRLKDGRHLGLYHRGPGGADKAPLEVIQTISADGGFTWSEPRVVASVEGKNPCEPFVFRSPDGGELCCLMRETPIKGAASSCSPGTRGTPGAPVGHALGLERRPPHRSATPRRTLDLRLPRPGPAEPDEGPLRRLGRPIRGHPRGKGGDYRIKLLHSHAERVSDCGIPGWSGLPDGTLVVTTYVKYQPGPEKHSVVATRFRIDETDAKVNR